jgi:hypothetical protein
MEWKCPFPGMQTNRPDQTGLVSVQLGRKELTGRSCVRIHPHSCTQCSSLHRLPPFRVTLVWLPAQLRIVAWIDIALPTEKAKWRSGASTAKIRLHGSALQRPHKTAALPPDPSPLCHLLQTAKLPWVVHPCPLGELRILEFGGLCQIGAVASGPRADLAAAPVPLEQLSQLQCLKQPSAVRGSWAHPGDDPGRCARTDGSLSAIRRGRHQRR